MEYPLNTKLKKAEFQAHIFQKPSNIEEYSPLSYLDNAHAQTTRLVTAWTLEDEVFCKN